MKKEIEKLEDIEKEIRYHLDVYYACMEAGRALCRIKRKINSSEDSTWKTFLADNIDVFSKDLKEWLYEDK